MTFLGNNTSAGSTTAFGGQGNGNTTVMGVQIFCDRSASKNFIEFRNWSNSSIKTVLLDSQMDNDDMRWITVTVESDLLSAYLNGSLVGTIDVTGMRDWLSWQGSGMDFGSMRGTLNRLLGNLAFYRLSQGALPPTQVADLYGLDADYYNL